MKFDVPEIDKPFIAWYDQKTNIARLSIEIWNWSRPDRATVRHAGSCHVRPPPLRTGLAATGSGAMAPTLHPLAIAATGNDCPVAVRRKLSIRVMRKNSMPSIASPGEHQDAGSSSRFWSFLKLVWVNLSIFVFIVIFFEIGAYLYYAARTALSGDKAAAAVEAIPDDAYADRSWLL